MAPNTNELPRLLLGISLGLLLCACRREAPSVNRSTGGEDTSSCTFSPPIADGADPWIVRRDDWYYLVESKNEGISVYRSKVLTDPKRNEVRVWSAPGRGLEPHPHLGAGAQLRGRARVHLLRGGARRASFTSAAASFSRREKTRRASTARGASSTRAITSAPAPKTSGPST